MSKVISAITIIIEKLDFQFATYPHKEIVSERVKSINTVYLRQSFKKLLTNNKNIKQRIA